MEPVGLLIILVILAALAAPLIPLRRRGAGFAGFPAVTLGLIFLNGVVFAASLTEGRLSEAFIYHWAMIPRHATVVTLVTHMFLHGSWQHLLGNMLGLWLFGPHVEEALGKLEYLLFYLGGGIAAGLLHLLICATLMTGAMDIPLVGASGAIFAVLGLFAVRFWRARVRVLLFFQVPAVWAVGVFALIQVFLGAASLANGGSGDGTANWAHVGGFVFGALLALPLRMREDSSREYGLEDAEKAAAQGNDETAAQHYRKILAVTPDDKAAHHALALVCVRLRHAEAAHRHLTDALHLYLRVNEPVAVARVYKDALDAFEAFPLAPTLLVRVASACEQASQYTLAQHALSELCRDHPDAREAELGLLRLGKLHLEKLNQPQNAAGIFGEFLHSYPQSEWVSHARRMQIEAESHAHPSTPVPAPGS